MMGLLAGLAVFAGLVSAAVVIEMHRLQAKVEKLL